MRRSISASLTLLVLLAVAHPAAAGVPLLDVPTTVAFPGGMYEGDMFAVGVILVDSATGQLLVNVEAEGGFDLMVGGGAVEEGSAWNLFGTEEMHRNGARLGKMTFDWGGAVVGSAAHPELSGPAHIQGTILGQPVDVTVSADEAAQPKLDIFVADCYIVAGDWTLDIATGIEAQGAEGLISGQFTAFHRGSRSARELQTYLQSVTEFVEGLPDSFSIPAFTELIALGEALQSRPDHDPEDCDEDLRDKFASLTSVLVLHVIKDAIRRPDAYSEGMLTFIVANGLRTGILGEGATNVDLADSLSESLHDIFADQLDSAIAEGHTGVILQVAGVALQMGRSWRDLYDRATAALGGGGGE